MAEISAQEITQIIKAQLAGQERGVDVDEVGTVVSGTLSPMLNEAIGSALVAAQSTQEPLQVDIRGTKLNLQLVKPPFVPLKKN